MWPVAVAKPVPAAVPAPLVTPPETVSALLMAGSDAPCGLVAVTAQVMLAPPSTDTSK